MGRRHEGRIKWNARMPDPLSAEFPDFRLLNPGDSGTTSIEISMAAMEVIQPNFFLKTT